jgi:hypothetical protein
MVLLGNVIKRFAKFLHDHLQNEGRDEVAKEVDGFLGSLRYNYGEVFGEAQFQVIEKRSETRKPANLPDENELKTLTQYVVTSLNKLSADTYKFISEAEYTFLRDLAVCRLTLLNARRGGEPSRLTLSQWREAENEVWKQNQKPAVIHSPEDLSLLERYKVAYQPGKGNSKLVPVIFPDDCLPALRLLADPEIRKDAGVNKYNIYLFPCTNLSDRHVTGSFSIRTIGSKANVTNITATKVRHRAATVYASLDVGEQKRDAFFKHMGHSDGINKNVYQCPPALLEVTKVGKFFHQLDTGNCFENRFNKLQFSRVYHKTV